MGARAGAGKATPPSKGRASKALPSRLEEAASRIQELGDDPIRAAVVARAVSGIVEVVRTLTKSDLGELASAASDYALFVEMLERPEVVAELRHKDPLMPARIRGLQARQELLESQGGALTVDEVVKILRLTRQGVDKRRISGKLLAVETGRRGFLYPAWQFTKSGVLRGLEAALSALEGHDPWARLWFFVTENTWLEGATPLEVLKRGEVEALLTAARNHGEQGAV